MIGRRLSVNTYIGRRSAKGGWNRLSNRIKCYRSGGTWFEMTRGERFWGGLYGIEKVMVVILV